MPALTERIEDAIFQKTRTGCTTAATRLREMRDLHERAGLSFDDYLTSLTEKRRRKTAFLAAVTREGLRPPS